MIISRLFLFLLAVFFHGCLLSATSSQSTSSQSTSSQSTSSQSTLSQFYIVGGGITGMLQAYYALNQAEQEKKPINILIFERNAKFSQTPAMNIFPSLTPDEILSVIPRGETLVKNLNIPFYKGNGIKVSDVSALNMQSKTVADFVTSAIQSAKDTSAYEEREATLLSMGKLSMSLWDELYRQADDELRAIMQAANYKPCKEVAKDEQRLGQGYRIDIFFGQPDVEAFVSHMVRKYRGLGYVSARVLDPEETRKIDPQLTGFVEKFSIERNGERQWKKDAHAIWRPGGCLNAHVFMMGLPNYLEQRAKKMGNGSSVRLLLDHDVVGINVTEEHAVGSVNVRVNGQSIRQFPEGEQASDASLQVVLMPGEAVGTLQQLGFDEPSYAIFAGPSLRLDIPLSDSLKDKYADLDHAMEVHQDGVVLAWQAKNYSGVVTIGIAGTKAFYGDVLPKNSESFAKNRHLLQLNAAYQLYPDLINQALSRKASKGSLKQADLDLLVQKRIARVWVGARAVAYDGFPTLGRLYVESQPIANVRAVTHLGSGGVSFGPAAVLMGQAITEGKDMLLESNQGLFTSVREFSDSRREASKRIRSL